jgi:hypothetical protein
LQAESFADNLKATERVIAQNLHSEKLLQYRGVDKLQFAVNAVHGERNKHKHKHTKTRKQTRKHENKLENTKNTKTRKTTLTHENKHENTKRTLKHKNTKNTQAQTHK